MSMKNIKWLLGAFSMLLAMTTFTACSDDDDKLEVPVFPESVVLNCQPGENESAELVFTANQPWTLASSKLWCKFSVDGELQNSLAGKAGEQKVQIIATDDVWDFENSLAEITLSMGGQTQAIAVVNHSGKLSVTFGAGGRVKLLEEELIRFNHKLLQDVVILDGDYRQTAEYTGANSLFYFDPPYKPVNEGNSCTSYMPQDFGDEEQINLANFCKGIGETGAK